MAGEVDDAMIRMNWIPGNKIGPFIFGDNIKKYLNQFHLQDVPEEYDDKIAHLVFTLPERDIRIYVDQQGNITSISCDDECWYQDVNMIGSNINDIADILDENLDERPESFDLGDEIQEVYRYHNMGVDFWVVDETVISVTCYKPEEIV